MAPLFLLPFRKAQGHPGRKGWGFHPNDNQIQATLVRVASLVMNSRENMNEQQPNWADCPVKVLELKSEWEKQNPTADFTADERRSAGNHAHKNS